MVIKYKCPKCGYEREIDTNNLPNGIKFDMPCNNCGYWHAITKEFLENEKQSSVSGY